MVKQIASSTRSFVLDFFRPRESPISFNQSQKNDRFFCLYNQTSWLIIINGLIVVSIIALFFYRSENWRSLFATLMALLPISIALLLQLYGHPRWSIRILVVGSFIAAWTGAFLNGGIHSIAIQAIYPIFVVITLFTTSNIFQLTTLITLICLGTLAYVQNKGFVFIDPLADDPTLSAFITGGIFLSTIFMLRFTANRTAMLNQELSIAQSKAFEAKQEAETANQLKSIFLANLSHELRTPLNAIIGYSEGLIEEQEMLTDESQRLHEEATQDIGRIIYSGRHLLNLINDIIDLSKIEADKVDLNIEPVALEDLIRNVVETVDPLTQKNHNRVLVKIEETITVETDRLKLTQILLNIVNNGTKFTQNGTVEITLQRCPVTNLAKIMVQDSGCGIEPEELPAIFEPFHRARRFSSHSVPGTGLGLAISNQLANKLGCELGVKSEVGVGSTFWLIIPPQFEH